MKTKNLAVYGLTCVLTIFGAVLASATTIVLPTDQQLVAKTPLIAEGHVVRSTPIAVNGTIWTETALAVDRTLKGNVAGEITIRELGGQIDDRVTKVFGAPVYAAGENVLAFLTPSPRGDYQTTDLYVGKFTQKRTMSGMRLWHRDDITADVMLLDSRFQPITAKNVQREADGFEQFVSDRVAGRQGANNYGVENPLLEEDLRPSHRIQPNFTLISEPSVYRWTAFERGASVAWQSFGTQTGYNGGGVNEVQTAMSAWSGFGSAVIRYTFAGPGSGSPGGEARTNGVNEVVFNDLLGEIAGSYNPSTGGVVGQGGFNGVGLAGTWTSTFTADSSHTQGSYRATPITEGFMTIQDGVSPSTGISSTLLAEIIAHEFGHTLGLGHSSDPTALMYPSVTGRGPSLRADDQLAARWLYPNGSAPAPAPAPTPTAPNAPSNLSAAASGSDIHLSWRDNASDETGQYVYIAASGGAFTRIGDAGAGATTAAISGVAAGTYNLRVTAFNSAGESAPSNTATVTISGSTPPPPAAPAAAFTVNVSSGIATTTTFIFTDQSTGTITSRQWNFGDGVISSVANPNHIYISAGSYTVVLTVSGTGGQSQATRTISVAAPAPVVPNVHAAFDFSPASPNVRDSVTFVDNTTGSPTSWSWSFGDGTISGAQNPVHAYQAPGTFFVTLTAYNSATSSVASRSVTVNPYAPYRSLVSVTAQTDGVGGSVWRTELTLFNAGTESASGQLLFIPAAGGSVQSHALFLAPKQALTFSNALRDIFGMPSGAGAIAIEATSASSTPTIKLTSRTFTSGGSGTYGQGVPSVASADLQQTLFVTGLESDSDYRTNIGLVNRGDVPVSVALTLYDGNGSTIGNSSVIVAANSFKQDSLGSFFPGVNNRAFTALSLRADAGIANVISVYASVIDNRTQDPVYLQATGARTGSRSVVPAVGRAAGANGTFWRSDLRLFNPTGATMPVTLRYLDATKPVAIAPNQTVVLSDIVSQFGTSAGSGALEVLWNGATGPIIASRTYTTAPNGGTFGQSIDAVQSFGYDSYVPGLRSDNAFRSNVGFVNSGDGTIGITATLLSASGQTLASAFVQLAPRGQTQYSLASLFPSLNIAALGSVTLQAHTDSAPVLFAYGSMVDNSSGDPVFFAGQ
ncbi:MAG: PKD domain-containing protein [Acidobacteriota bacterium]|nr:PKD domain-containing protein [Acidobacteriota bacterium]